MKRSVAATRLVASLTRERVLLHDAQRSHRNPSERVSCFLRQLRTPPAAVDGGEIVALLAVSRACDRAAGNR